MPRLHEQLVTGEVSINKLARVASIATPENEVELSKVVQNMSQKAVETLVKDEKFTGLRAQILTLNDEVTKRLTELQSKGIDVNELISAALNKREEEIAEGKSVPVQPASSRTIPVATKRLIQKNTAQNAPFLLVKNHPSTFTTLKLSRCRTHTIKLSRATLQRTS